MMRSSEQKSGSLLSYCVNFYSCVSVGINIVLLSVCICSMFSLLDVTLKLASFTTFVIAGLQAVFVSCA